MRTTKTYMVDVPNSDPTQPWTEVAEFRRKRDAVAFCKKHYGADDNGRVSLITEVES